MSSFSPTSLFKESNFRLQLRQDTPAMEVMVNVTNIPGFSIGQIDIPRPGLIDKRPGQQLTFEDLSLDILCDEKLTTYKEIYEYITTASNPKSANYEIEFPIFDATLFLTTNKNNIQHQIRFLNCFFKTVSSIGLKAITTDDVQVGFSVVIGYTYFEFI